MSKNRTGILFGNYISFALLTGVILIILFKCGQKAILIDTHIPEFPWPPPQASSTIVIPSKFLIYSTGKIVRLYDINKRLSTVMDSCGYLEKSYYAVPDGFAVVTRLEQIKSDGTPKDAPERWSTDVGPLRRFSLQEYLRALFTANPGYYRIIVFIVTSHPFSQSKARVSHSEAMDWLRGGLNILPSSIGENVYTDDYNTTALIYEFELLEVSAKPNLKVPGRLGGQTHLEKSKLWNSLER